MKIPAFPRPPAVARSVLALLALATATVSAFGQFGQGRGQPPYSPNNPLAVAQREIQKAETNAVTFDPQSPERNALEGRAQQLRAQIAESVLIYGAGVNKPGLYQPKPGLTVTEAIKLAGGTTPDADVTRVNLRFKTNRIGRSQGGAGEFPTQYSGAGIDLSDIKPVPAGILSDGFPPARTTDPRAQYVMFSYDFVVVAGDSIRVDATEFRFEGGTPKDFLKAIDAHYITDWQDLANIPPEAAEVKVPKIKTSLRQTVTLRGEEQIQAKSATALLDLYNALAAEQRVLGKLDLYNALGKWKMPEPAGAAGGRGGGFGGQGSPPPPPHPDLILPQPVPTSTNAPAADQPLRVRSISLVGIPRERWVILERELAELNDSAAALGAKMDPAGAPRRFIGSVQLSPGAGVLLVIGNMEYIELVDTFIGAKRYEAANTKNQ
jgi:hypothetical protein